MDSETPCLDFAIIGHQENWENISSFIHGIRQPCEERLANDTIKGIFSFIPSRDIFRVKVRSATGSEINGVYIETFIDPDKLDPSYTRTNISKVKAAILWAKKMKAGIVTLGGFTSIVLEGNFNNFSSPETTFTTGNTLAAAYISKGVEKAANEHGINIKESNLLVIGATGDIGTACVEYFKNKAGRILLCARNSQRLSKYANCLAAENVQVSYSVIPDELIAEADIIISAASSSEINPGNCKSKVLICDAGYPKNLIYTASADIHLFHGGMGQVSQGYDFSPDYSPYIFQSSGPYIIHGCILEAVVLAFEKRNESYSYGKGNITMNRIEEIYSLAHKHGIGLAPFYNADGLW